MWPSLALALGPDLVIADEVVSALDVSVQAQILMLMNRLRVESGSAFLFISHDLAVVSNMSDRIAVMYQAKVVEELPTAHLLVDPCHPYTVALMSAVGVPDPTVEGRRERIVLRGEPPDPLSPPSGCRFHPRCWLRRAMGDPKVCSSEEPPLVEVGMNHRVACHFVQEARESPRPRYLHQGPR